MSKPSFRTIKQYKLKSFKLKKLTKKKQAEQDEKDQKTFLAYNSSKEFFNFCKF
jgi:hypothetical protein